MTPPLISLLAATTAFLGSHFVLSHTLRAPLVKALGDTGFMILYNLVAFATFGWTVFAFMASPPADLGGSGTFGWAVATLLTLPATLLLLGAIPGNPALPRPDAAELAMQAPSPIFQVTRHPMMWSIALWAIAHITLWWTMRTLIVAGGMLLLALVGAHLQDRKKRVLMGDSWAAWVAHTSYWPRIGALFHIGWGRWAVGIAVWLGLSRLHLGFGIPAGIWRWI